jgi:hypothetical protein
MAFVPLVLQSKAVLFDATGVKATLAKYRGGPAQLTLSITCPASSQAKLKGGKKVEILIGTGSDHGVLKIRNSDVGQVESVEKKGAKSANPSHTLRLGHQAAFVDRAEKAQSCTWEMVDGWLEVVLPKWADETHPSKQPKPKATMVPGCVPAYEPRRAARGKRNVTADLMGDPKPGRSALSTASV